MTVIARVSGRRLASFGIGGTFVGSEKCLVPLNGLGTVINFEREAGFAYQNTIQTDYGIEIADLPKNRNGWTARYRVPRSDHGIEHRLKKPDHPWTNGQVERMYRTIKYATVKRYHYDSHNQLRQHLQLFIYAYSYGRRLKKLQRANALRICRPHLDRRAKTNQNRSISLLFGTKHLVVNLKIASCAESRV
jgi:Integrase core domain